MIIFNDNYQAQNAQLVKNSRWILELDFSGNGSDLFYFTSHDDCLTPVGVPESQIIRSVVKNVKLSSQNIDTRANKFSIGSNKFTILDDKNRITELLNSKLNAGFGVRGKRLRAYKGFKGLSFTDYVLPPSGTQFLYSDLIYNNNSYKFITRDIQWLVKTEIFEPKTTTLGAVASYTKGDSVVTVTNNSEFETINHNASFTDSPSVPAVGYFYIEKDNQINVIRYTAKVGNTFTGCVGGLFGTIDFDLTVDPGQSADQRPKVTEFIYLELPAPLMILCILGTGSGINVPDHWKVGLTPADVATSRFLTIGEDLYNPAALTSGFILRFINPGKQNAKKFLESQVCLPSATFMPILSDGQIGLTRRTGIISSSSTIATLDSSNTISYKDTLRHDLDEVQNNYFINWGSVIRDGKTVTNRDNGFIDNNSIALHGNAEPVNLQFKGLSGSRYTQDFIYGTFLSLRDRYAGPPIFMNAEVFNIHNNLELADVVQCDWLARDFNTGETINSAFEIIGFSDNGTTTTLKLFASSLAAEAQSLNLGATVLNDSYYSEFSSGSPSVPLLPANNLANALTTTLIGSVLHVTANGNLPTVSGTSLEDDVNNIRNIYWYDGNVEIDAGVVVTWSHNIALRVRGIVVNGTITGEGAGVQGALQATNVGSHVQGTIARVGTTVSGGGVYHRKKSGGSYRGGSLTGITLAGAWANGVPNLNIVNNGGTSISGIPADLRGTSGSTGRSNNDTTGNNVNGLATGFPEIINGVVTTGGAGGRGGGSMLLTARQMSSGASGRIIVSGGAGQLGDAHSHSGGASGFRFRSGGGAGGAPGCVIKLIDGNGIDTLTVLAQQGLSPVDGKRLQPGSIGLLETGPVLYSHFLGAPVVDHQSHVRTIYIPAGEAPIEDLPQFPPTPTAINVTQAPATNNTMNIVYLEISVVGPTTSNYQGTNIYIRPIGTNAFVLVGQATSTDEVVVPVPSDGTTYQIKGHPVNLEGQESLEFFGTVDFTVTASSLAVIGPGNGLGTSLTVGNGSLGEGVLINEDGISGYDNSGTLKLFIDATTGTITAIDGIFTGNITANSGFIGGWTINSNNLTSGNLVLDGGLSTIQAGPNASNYVRMSEDGLIGINSTLGTVFNLPTDGTPPTFSSGIINSTVFNITTSGILETSANAGDGSTSGVRLNDAGISVYNAFSVFPTFSSSAITGNTTIIGSSLIITDWAAVSGSNLPAANADQTVVALNNSTTISSNGIVLSGNGAIRGGQTAFNTGNGFFLGVTSGTPEFSIGNSAANIGFTFGGSTFSVLENTKILGVSSYENDNVYIDDDFSSLDGYNITNILGALATINGNRVTVSDSSTLNSSTGLNKNKQLALAVNTWNKRYLKTTALFQPSTTMTGHTFRFVSGGVFPSVAAKQCGYLVIDGVVNIFCNRNGTTTQIATAETISPGQVRSFELRVSGGVAVFLTGPDSNSTTVLGTISTNVPLAADIDNTLYGFSVVNTGGAGTLSVSTSQIKLLVVN